MKKERVYILLKNLELLADDLVAAIELANFAYCAERGQTAHMREAIANYFDFIKEPHNV